MWRLGFDNPPDFNDHQGFCGGFKHQYGRMGGQCGICGDPADAWPRQHEAPGGRFANGLITRQYKPGQDIVVKVDVTANHKGFFTFKLCSNNDTAQDPRQECFDKTVLRVVPSGEDRYYVDLRRTSGLVRISLLLGVHLNQLLLSSTLKRQLPQNPEHRMLLSPTYLRLTSLHFLLILRAIPMMLMVAWIRKTNQYLS